MSNRRTKPKEEVLIGRSTRKIKLKYAPKKVKESFLRCELAGKGKRILIERRTIIWSKDNKYKTGRKLQVSLILFIIILVTYLLGYGKMDVVELISTVKKLFL